MKSFRQYLSEAISTKGIKVPKPDIEDDGYKVYTYPGPTDILQVGIGPKEDGAHHIWFTHGGSFGKIEGIKHTPAQTMHVLNHVAATLQNHSKKHKATEYTYETGIKTRHNLYQRMARFVKVNAVNTVPEGDLFDRHKFNPDNQRPIGY